MTGEADARTWMQAHFGHTFGQDLNVKCPSSASSGKSTPLIGR
jgi:hypothetical protein